MANEPSVLNVVLPILTGVAGFLGGILSESLKQLTTQWITKRNLKRIVYIELAQNLDALAMVAETPVKGKTVRTLLDLNLSYTNFEFAETQPLIFHQLPEAITIRNIYSGFRMFLSSKSADTVLAGAKTILDRCDRDIIDKGLDIKYLMRFKDLEDLNRHLAKLTHKPSSTSSTE